MHFATYLLVLWLLRAPQWQFSRVHDEWIRLDPDIDAQEESEDDPQLCQVHPISSWVEVLQQMRRLVPAK